MKMTLWLASLFSLAISATVLADVLEIPQPVGTDIESESLQPEPTELDSEIPQPEATDIESQPTEVITTTLPGKGMTKDSVEERFGSPVDKIEAIGDPPISRWLYDSFTVYFEYDHVIHAVNHK